MTTSPTGHKNHWLVRIFRRLPGREDIIVIWVILIAVASNLINLYPEVAVDVTDLNDNAFHLLATEAAAAPSPKGKTSPTHGWGLWPSVIPYFITISICPLYQ